METIDDTLTVAHGHILAAQCTVAAMRAARRGDMDEHGRLKAMADRVRSNARWMQAQMEVV